MQETLPTLSASFCKIWSAKEWSMSGAHEALLVCTMACTCMSKKSCRDWVRSQACPGIKCKNKSCNDSIIFFSILVTKPLSIHWLRQDPFEALLVIFGRGALFFFVWKLLEKYEKWYRFCAHAQWWSPWRRKNVEKRHLAPSNLTF